MKLDMEVGLGPGAIVLDGDPAPPKRGSTAAPQFSAMSVVAKRLDGLRCHLVRRWASALATLCYMGTQPSETGHGPPVFGPGLLWPNGWMNQDATW